MAAILCVGAAKRPGGRLEATLVRDQTSPYSVNAIAVARATELIEAHQYVFESDWEDQPSADDEKAYLENHTWDEYAVWHIALTEGATDETKAATASSWATSAGSTSGLIACQYRAAQWRHKQVELAAQELLQLLGDKSG